MVCEKVTVAELIDMLKSLQARKKTDAGSAM